LFEWNYVTTDYFRAFTIPLLQGRTFTSQDEDQASEIALKIREVFSKPNPQTDALKGHWVADRRSTARWPRLVWPKQDPIGRTFVIGGALSVQVVGVVGDVKVGGCATKPCPGVFPLHGRAGWPGSAARRQIRGARR